MGKKSITLTFPHIGREGDVYRIDTVEGSTEFKPGRYLTEAEVDELCKSIPWTVKMKQKKD